MLKRNLYNQPINHTVTLHTRALNLQENWHWVDPFSHKTMIPDKPIKAVQSEVPTSVQYFTSKKKDKKKTSVSAGKAFLEQWQVEL